MDLATLFLLILLLFLSALFSSSETALVGLSRYRAKELGKLVKWLKENESKALITILIGNNLVNVALSVLASLIAEKYGGTMIAIATFIITFLIVTFGEIIPKNLAIRNKVAVLKVSAPLIYALTKILWPVVVIYEKLVELVSKKKEEHLTYRELEQILLDSIKDPMLRVIADNMFDLSKLKVKYFMTPWKETVKFTSDEPVSESLKRMQRNDVTKLVSEDGEYYVTILDLLFKEGKTISYAKPTKKVPAETNLVTALKLFKENKYPILVIVDEFGNNIGVLTLRDVLEGLVGELEPIEGIKKTNKNTYLVDGDVLLTELDDVGIRLPLEGATTIGGLIVRKLGRPAKVGDTLDIENYKIVVKEVTKSGLPRKVEIKIL